MNTTVNFLLRRCLKDVNTGQHRDKFSFFSESELAIGCGPQDSEGKFTYICHFKIIEINARKVLQKGAFIFIARDVFVAFAIVVAKAPYIH